MLKLSKNVDLPIDAIPNRQEQNGMLIYRTNLLPAMPTADQIQSQGITLLRFSVMVGGTIVFIEDVPIVARDPNADSPHQEPVFSREYGLNEGDEAVLTGQFGDASPANWSAFRANQSFTAHDTIPADAPGDFGESSLLRQE